MRSINTRTKAVWQNPVARVDLERPKMLAEVAGFTLTRTIPDKASLEVLTGLYEVCGGLIRNQSGQVGELLEYTPKAKER